MSGPNRVPAPWGIVLLAGLGACGLARGRVETVVASSRAEARPPSSTEARGRILAARAERGEGVDRVHVVFDRPVDPSTVVPRAFRIVTRAGGWAVPERAYLEPADLGRAGYVVVLEGEFGIGAGGPPWSVTVVGRLAAQDGATFAGLGSEVLPDDAPVRVRRVACARPPVAASCAGTALLVVADGPIAVDGATPSRDGQGRNSASAHAAEDAHGCDLDGAPAEPAFEGPDGAPARGASPVAVVCRAPDGALPVLRDGRGRTVNATAAATSRCGRQRTPVAHGAVRSR